MTAQQTRPARKPARMPPPVRKLFTLLHIVFAISWLASSVVDLILALLGQSTDEPELQHAAYRVLGVLGDYLVLPLSWATLITGVLMAMGTGWGLARHKWVLTKLSLTVLTVTLVLAAFLPSVHEAVAAVESTPAGQLADVGGAASDLSIAGSVSLAIYLFNAFLSVFKPWGRTKFASRTAQTAKA
ncbi:hypothetical protein [Amycolatopsis nigrescens]|uniref:hypothetical protein n=1 Tax=Amycolatopsis nigrescens TaxID=381445 RepID=UPI0003708C83|nr:hypothetical protein [Amycolatopsis nigrescens]